MQAELRNRLRSGSTLASTTAGLASVFTAIGDRHLKNGGRIALVVPAAIMSGGAWEKTRALLDNGYSLEFVVSSHDATRWSFSENTDLSEVLLVAKKKSSSDEGGDSHRSCTFINLWRNPTAAADALSLGESIEILEAAAVGSPESPTHAVASVNIGDEKWGEALTIPLSELYGQPWLGAAFAHTELVRANWLLRKGNLLLPGGSRTHRVNLCRLEELGQLGPDGRDIHDGFTHGTTETGYPAFWNHEADRVLTIAQRPNEYLLPRIRPAVGRPRRPASLLWPRASKILLAVRLRFNTHRLTAIRLDTDALSNVWYPLRINAPNEDREKALLLWLNSSLGILLLAGHRVPTQGAWVQFKKPTLNPLPVMDVRSLDDSQLGLLRSAYDAVATRELLPLQRMDIDPVRREIDDAISHALSIPSIASLRTLLAHEPILQDSPLWTPSTASPGEQRPEQFQLIANA